MNANTLTNHPDQLLLDCVVDKVWETGEPAKGWQLFHVTLANADAATAIETSADTCDKDLKVNPYDVAALLRVRGTPEAITLGNEILAALMDQAMDSARHIVLFELQVRSDEEALQIDPAEAA